MFEVTRLNFIKKPPFVGYFSLYIPKWGIDINSCSLFERDGKYWFTLPSHEYVTKAGETKHAPYFRFREKRHWELFEQYVLKAVDDYLEKKING